ncbi:MAG: efflux RND transporter periplasmic adaptor subunit [Planctomycetes bacterium]|jgi:multidrug resistance efflux pump|nr:efflux RND transporter periplasmic adaptor subunit [Planctomycetota bacterium]
MTVSRTQIPSNASRVGGTFDLVDRLSRFDGPPDQFLLNLLSVQCHMTAAEGGAVLRMHKDGPPQAMAVFPPLQQGATAPVWLAQAVECSGALAEAGRTIIRPLHSADDLYGAAAKRHLVMVPISEGDSLRGYEAFLLETSDQHVLAASRERLELTVGLLSLYEIRLTLQAKQFDLQRVTQALETLCCVNETERFTSAAMAMCNELASRWKCLRVSLGFARNGGVHLAAMSHTEKLDRKMKLVRDIEAAMEECLDQDIEIFHPGAPEAAFVSRFTADLSRQHGQGFVASFPLRRRGECVGVLTIERDAQSPLELPQIEAMRLICDLASPRLLSLREHDKWFGAKLASAAIRAARTLAGPKHTAAKLAGAGIIAFMAFIFLGKGDYTADAPFVLETARRHIVSSPFDGYIKQVLVDPDDPVEAGVTVLAVLDDADLQKERLAALAEQAQHQRDFDAALAEGKTVEAQIAKARFNRVAQQIKLLEGRIERATLISPVDGKVLAGDLKQRLNAPVRTGDRLFEVGPTDALYADIAVSEDMIPEIMLNQRGELATTSRPDRRLGFTVTRIHPVAEIVDQQSVFKVRAALDAPDSQLRPGMEGVAKIHIGKRSYAWLWTHRLVDWLQMKLWW